MRRRACETAVVLVAALAASPGRGGTAPVITGIDYENGLTGIAEDAGWVAGTNPRHVTIIVSTPASEVTEVRFCGVDVNSAGLLPYVADRFDPATDTEVDALGDPNPNAIRVEAPPRMWPLGSPTRDWPDVIPVTVMAGSLQSNDFPLRYLGAPEVQCPADLSDPYMSTSGASVTWLTRDIPDASNVEVEFTGPGGTFAQTGADLTVGINGTFLIVDSVPLPPTPLGEYDVTVAAYPGTPDEMSTSKYDWGDPIKVYMVHPPAAVAGVTATDSSPIYFIPISGDVPVVIEGTAFHHTTGGIPDSGTEVRVDYVPVRVDSYDLDTQHMTVTVPPCPEMIERPIRV
ncbi:MAG: hypothetical protein ACYTKD_10215 [Planctomycetota bacterium]